MLRRPMEGVQTMDLGSLTGATGAEWIGKPPHEELDRKARPLLPSEDPFYLPPPGYQHALREACCAHAMLSWRFSA
jgi:hypothetical protein